MRITGGTLTGRNLRTADVPGLRPTKDMVRQSVFGMLAASLPGTRVLDLFAGSGAAGLEAWSRGAEHVTWVERDREIHRVLCANVADLAGAGPGLLVLREEAFRFLEGPACGGPYHLVFADPPYEAATEGRWLEKTLRTLETRPILTEKGVLVFEGKTGAELPPLDGWQVLRDKTYGSTRVLFLRRNPAPEA